MDITERKKNELAQQATYRIAQAAFETKDLNALYRSIHSILLELMPAENLLIVLYDAAMDLFHISYLKDEFDQDTAPYHPGKGLCGYVLRTGQPLLVTPALFEEMERRGEVEILIRRMVDWLGVPLITQRGTIGVIAIQTYTPAVRLSPEHQALLMFVSTQIANAIERQQALAESQKFNQQLEQTVRDRTARLETANHELESFSYSVSHDLRAPLRAIRGYSQILMSEQAAQLSAEGRDYLGKVIDGAHQMNTLIEALLSLSRMSRGELRKTRLNLTEMARAVVKILTPAESTHAVTCDIAEGLSAYADEKLLDIVLQNLLGNAWKYTARIPNAHIEFGRQSQNGETIFFVRDNGIGFDMKYSDKLFGAFQRLHPVDEYPGHGIGLATVQRIITRHGGRVWAEGQPNVGATFYFSLPAEKE
jgi:signal transduction histidine kinase